MQEESSTSFADIDRGDEKGENASLIIKGKRTIESEDDVLHFVKSRLGEGGGSLKTADTPKVAADGNGSLKGELTD